MNRINLFYANNDKFGLPPRLTFQGKRKYSTVVTKTLTILFFIYIIYSLINEGQKAILSPKFKMKDINSLAENTSRFEFSQENVPIMVEFMDPVLNGEWYNYFDIYFYHFDPNDDELAWEPTFYELEPCETEDIPDEFDDFEIEDFGGYYCLPSEMSHKIQHKGDTELQMVVTFCDTTDSECVNLSSSGDEADRIAFVEKYDIEIELLVHFLAQDVEFRKDDSELKEQAFTKNIYFNIFS